MDIEAAVGGCDPYFPTILLAHQPKAAKMALETDHRIDLVLSGISTEFHHKCYLTNAI